MLRQFFTDWISRILSRTGFRPTTDRLGAWVATRHAPFTLGEAAEALGIKDDKLTRDVRARIGIALQKLGCKKIEIRPPYQTRLTTHYVSPDAINAEDQSPSELSAKWRSEFAEIGRLTRVERPLRKSIFIGTTNEQELLAASGLVDSRSRRPIHHLGQSEKRSLHHLSGSAINTRCFVDRLKHLTKPVVEHLRRLLGK